MERVKRLFVVSWPFVLVLGAALMLVSCCQTSTIGGALPDPPTRPKLRAPVVLIPEGGLYRARALAGQVELEANELLGFDSESGPALVGYVKELEEEVRWLRSHPAFAPEE